MATTRGGAESVSAWRRIAAFGVDYVLILLIIGLLTLFSIGVPLGRRVMALLFANPVAGDISAFVLLILPVILYFSLTEGSARGASWGKRRMGIRVVDDAGEPLSFRRALARNLLKFLPWQVGHTAIFQSGMAQIGAEPELALWHYLLFGLAYGGAALYVAMLWLHPRGRTLYDLAVGSVVVPAPASELAEPDPYPN